MSESIGKNDFIAGKAKVNVLVFLRHDAAPITENHVSWY